MSLPLLVTMGEPAGIGAEITQKAWRALREEGPVFALLDDVRRLTQVPVIRIEAPEQAAGAFRDGLPVLHRTLPAPVTPGKPNVENAGAVISSIEEAVGFCKAGRAGGVITNPIQKSVLTAAGFTHPGHTEFLGELAGRGVPPVMMLTCPDIYPTLRSVPVTIHLSLRKAVDRLTEELIVETAATTARALREDFGIEKPRLALSGLNPHAGEAGTMGSEERDIIIPAIERLRGMGIAVSGPWPADTMFTGRARASYDAALAMTHDQALIPVKTLDMDGGVNITLGLSIIRTSPDHGTALDIAGKGIADAGSLIAAIREAATLARNRQA
ncbi:4-hydroxythreonine-4-phosphate dehydrogenase PdxA [Acetobacteraceae bacterium H6797]|nr:4-hydroxythreonine-4-phosphate dehydrogenase PdxA [Acetobacteraceae bacterium H6797]